MNPEGNQSPTNEFWNGVGFALACVLAAEAILFCLMLISTGFGVGDLAGILIIALFPVGWTQLLYLPAIAIYQGKVTQRSHRTAGIWAASMSLLLMTSLCNAAFQVF